MEWLIFLVIVGGFILLAAIFGRGTDTTRDKLCAGLRAMGVGAWMAERGRPEEKTGKGSLGVIDIGQGPIRWVNVREVGDSENTAYMTEYGVPDQRHLPQLQIRSVRVKTFPVFGRVIDVRWKGNDLGLGIAQRLSNDESIRGAIMGTRDEVTVQACSYLGCWLIVRDTEAAPSQEQLGCYQAIAENLLVQRLPGPQGIS